MSEDLQEIKWADRKHWMWFPWTFTKYKIQNERLYVQRGLLRTTYDETLLYRIVDLRLERSLLQKIFGTGTIRVFTKVDVAGEILLENIKKSVEVKSYISDLVENTRRAKNVVGKEFFGTGAHHGVDLDGDGILEDGHPGLDAFDLDGDGHPDTFH